MDAPLPPPPPFPPSGSSSIQTNLPDPPPFKPLERITEDDSKPDFKIALQRMNNRYIAERAEKDALKEQLADQRASYERILADQRKATEAEVLKGFIDEFKATMQISKTSHRKLQSAQRPLETEDAIIIDEPIIERSKRAHILPQTREGDPSKRQRLMSSDEDFANLSPPAPAEYTELRPLLAAAEQKLRVAWKIIQEDHEAIKKYQDQIKGLEKKVLQFDDITSWFVETYLGEAEGQED